MLTGGGPTPASPITVDNWQLPPFNRWSYWNVGLILPTQRIAAGGSARPLPDGTARCDVLGVGLTRVSGLGATVAEVLADTYTDAYVVLEDGAVVAEWYGPEGAPERTHALMSITKSVIGCVAAVLIERGMLDADRPITDYVAELAGSGYAGATVRHVLDMRSGVRFREDYTDPDAEIRALGESMGWGRPAGVEPPYGLYGYLTGLSAEAPHGQRFLYRSAETDVLGWVCERAAGQPMADLITELVWQPMGAEFDAEILCDTTGTAIHDGGMCATARDMARFGQMLLDGGTVPGDDGDTTHPVIPPQWLRQAWGVDADVRSVFAGSPAEVSMPGGWYRNQMWFRPGEHGDVLLCLGIHGQMIHVSRRTRTVCVKFSTWPDPQIPAYLQDTLRAFDAIGGALTGRPHGGDRHRLPGIVAGISRHGTADRSATPPES